MKIPGEEKNFLGIEGKYSSIDNSKIVILSAPLEATVSYGGGTARGPREILKASHYVEFYDEEFDPELCFEKEICTYEPMKLDNFQFYQFLVEEKSVS